MTQIDNLKENLQKVELKLHISFEDKNLLLLSFVHSSFMNENKNLINEHNERLEYLGDTVLNLIVSTYLYKVLPDVTEGVLSTLRSHIVDLDSCATFYKKLELEKYLLLGKGEEKTIERGRDTILADALEALIGAIYLDKGFDLTYDFFIDNFKDNLEKILKSPNKNYKALLQEFSQKRFQRPPVYVIVEEKGPDHAKIFEIDVFVNNEKMGTGFGSSKKEGENAAATDAINKIKE
jgi:ribonuclease III